MGYVAVFEAKKREIQSFFASIYWLVIGWLRFRGATNLKIPLYRSMKHFYSKTFFDPTITIGSNTSLT